MNNTKSDKHKNNRNEIDRDGERERIKSGKFLAWIIDRFGAQIENNHKFKYNTFLDGSNQYGNVQIVFMCVLRTQRSLFFIILNFNVE